MVRLVQETMTVGARAVEAEKALRDVFHKQKDCTRYLTAMKRQLEELGLQNASLLFCKTQVDCYCRCLPTVAFHSTVCM